MSESRATVAITHTKQRHRSEERVLALVRCPQAAWRFAEAGLRRVASRTRMEVLKV